MKFLLDTNVCIRYLQGRSPRILQEIQSRPRHSLWVCSVVKAELFYGAMKSDHPVITLARQRHFLDRFVSLPFDDEAAVIFGEIRADLAQKGTPIGPYDLQIAAIALANDLTLVTHNTAEFGRIGGLKLEDWEV
jgi:tRNA(fMet)-specific endonuclease VapC